MGIVCSVSSLMDSKDGSGWDPFLVVPRGVSYRVAASVCERWPPGDWKAKSSSYLELLGGWWEKTFLSGECSVILTMEQGW